MFRTVSTYSFKYSRGREGSNITFDIPFANYSDWFGESGVGKNFWLGLDNMNNLSTNGKTYSLQIDLCCGTQLMAKQLYTNFKVRHSFFFNKVTAKIRFSNCRLLQRPNNMR